MASVTVWYMCARCGAYTKMRLEAATLGDALSKYCVLSRNAQVCSMCSDGGREKNDVVFKR